MKIIVLIFVISHHQALSQFNWPGFSSPILQIPAPIQINLPTVPSTPFTVGPASLRIFDQFFNFSAPNPIVEHFNLTCFNLTEHFSNLFNVSNWHNFLLPEARSDVNISSIPQSIRKTLLDALAQFEKSTNATLVRGVSRVQDSFARLNETASSIITMVESVTTKSIEDIENNINQLNATVQRCVRANVSQFEDILTAAREESETCINDKVEGGEAIIEEGQANIIAAIYGARNLSATIQQCSAPDIKDHFFFGAVGCYTSAIVNIRRDTLLLPLQMTKRFGEIDAYISSTRAEVIRCTTSVVETIAEQSLGVSGTIATCLLEKEPENVSQWIVL